MSPAKSAALSALLPLHLPPALRVAWEVHGAAQFHSRKERKGGKSSSGPSAKCGEPVGVDGFPSLFLY